MRRGITRPQGRARARLHAPGRDASCKFINGAEDRGHRVLPAP